MTTRILHIEDSETDAKLVRHELERSGAPIDVRRVESADGLREALREQSWDIVLCDWSMPKFSALSALTLLAEERPELPFIIVSGSIGEETAVAAMRAGARDYVLKDQLARLSPVVEREILQSRERAGRREVEDALRASESRFRRLSDSGIIGILIADMEGTFLEVNDAYAQMMGYSRTELLEGPIKWPSLIPDDCKALAFTATERLRRDGFAPPWETDGLRRDGSRVAMLVGVAMLESSKCIGFTADLSARKEAEQARIRAEEALRQRDEQLRQVQKMDAVGRLAGGVAHDFNNLLSVIMSYGELIASDLRPGDPMRADVEEIRKAASRAAGLTRQLLLFSRQQIVEPKVLDLNEVLGSMDKMLQRILGEDVELVSVNTKAVGRVRADPSHIEQVILNLVVNARDAMPTGGRLTIETANVVLDEEYALGHVPAKPGHYVMVAVSDTGTGMDKVTQSRIFEPFFTTKPMGKGTGLGLSTVFGIVQQSGGNIWVYSEIGAGTTFKVYLPRVAAVADSVHPPAPPMTLRGTERILLVEDEEQVRTIALHVLRKQGYRVSPAQNAGEALLLCEQQVEAFDLLLTDVVMPQMSGPELAKRLAVTHPRMKVLCMSGYTDDSIVRHGVLEASIAFLQKPITPGALARKVREVLDRDLQPGDVHRVPEENT